jgi:hypothetical protein
MTILIASVLFSMVIGCQQKPSPSPPPSEADIPARYTAYTNEQGLFSISYPSDWELYFHTDEEWEYSANKIINSIESDVPLERSYVYYIAGLPESDYIPGVQIQFAPLPEGVSTHDDFVDTMIAGVGWEDFHMNTRLKTTVDGRGATIVDYQGTHHNSFRLRVLTLVVMRTDKVSYAVACASTVEDFSKWEDDFYHVLESFHILR